MKKLREKTCQKSLFSVTLATWGQLNTLHFLKNFSILLKPISKGNFILLIDATIPIFFLTQAFTAPYWTALVCSRCSAITFITLFYRSIDIYKVLPETRC